MQTQRITLDNPVFAGRLRNHDQYVGYKRRQIIRRARRFPISDVVIKRRPYLRIAVNNDSSKPHNNTQPKTQNQSGHTSDTRAGSDNYVGFIKVAEELPHTKESTANKIPLKTRKMTTTLLVGMSVVIFLFGITVLFFQLKTNKNITAQAQQMSSARAGSGSVTPPDETAPSNIRSYSVPPGDPRFITIPKLSVEARVVKKNVDSNGQLGTPNNIFDTGWYQKSALPGDAGGAILIDGHVHGPTKQGVFYDLKKLVAGDVINIERGDSKKYNFKVVKIEYYPDDKVDMAAAMMSVDPSKLGLNLITCTGKLRPGTTQYEQRLIVFAVAS